MINMYNHQMPQNTTYKNSMDIFESTIIKNNYYNYIYSLKNIICNKEVESYMVGTSGYILQFTDNFFVVCYLDDNKLNWTVDEAIPNPLHLYLIDFDIDSEDENTFSTKEFNNCCKQTVNDIKISENSFNLCFINKLEIKSTIDLNNPFPNLKLSICHSN